MKRPIAVLSIITCLSVIGCGGGTNNMLPPPNSADPFGGSFEARLIPTQISCRYGNAQLQIAGMVLTGTGASDGGTQSTAVNFTVAGTLTFLAGESTAQLLATATDANGAGYTLQLSGTATSTVSGVFLSGNYSDSFGCEGSWASR